MPNAEVGGRRHSQADAVDLHGVIAEEAAALGLTEIGDAFGETIEPTFPR